MYRIKFKSEKDSYWSRMFSNPTFNKVGTLIPKKSSAETTIRRLKEYYPDWDELLEIEEVEIVVKGIVS